MAHRHEKSGRVESRRQTETVPQPKAVQNIWALEPGEKPAVSHVVRGQGWEDAIIEATFSVGGTSAVKRQHQARVIFDFSECSREEILGLALRECRIRVQRTWNTLAASDLATATRPGTFARVNVKADLINGQRRAADPMVKVVRDLAKALGVPEEEAQKIIEAGKSAA